MWDVKIGFTCGHKPHPSLAMSERKIEESNWHVNSSALVRMLSALTQVQLVPCTRTSYVVNCSTFTFMENNISERTSQSSHSRYDLWFCECEKKKNTEPKWNQQMAMNQTLNFGVSQRTCSHEHWRFGEFDVIIFGVVHNHSRSPHMPLVVKSQVSAERSNLFPYIHALGTYPMTADIALQTSRVLMFQSATHS